MGDAMRRGGGKGIRPSRRRQREVQHASWSHASHACFLQWQILLELATHRPGSLSRNSASIYVHVPRLGYLRSSLHSLMPSSSDLPCHHVYKLPWDLKISDSCSLSLQPPSLDYPCTIPQPCGV
ncbi:hypothetical protein KC19_VG171700 [Ceratodon purpureus]|uniref:Uncharacterized protein n=1 Tax=Ceratodon purpureus TaxID=3225 RepID=A0A8T0HQZ1_CERPU|nr:hypothetical protein KC19_VG171700 [Ceratodon purpureus]